MPRTLSPTVLATLPSRLERIQERDSRRPVVITGGKGGAPLSAPTLDNLRVEDLEDTGRLLRLHDQAVARELVSSSEADRLKFVAAAEHARAVGRANPCGLFARLVRRGFWHFATQDDEDRASRRLKSHLFGPPREVCGGGLRAGLAMEPQPSEVRGVRAAMIRAGIFRDPFPAFRARNPGWTRERWEAGWAESVESRGAT